MAFNIQDTTYSGKYSAFFIMRATYGMDTVKKRFVNIVGNIKKQYTIKRLDVQQPLKPRLATQSDDNQNPFTIDGRLIIPKDVDIYKEFNPRDLEQTDTAELLSNTILDRQVPATLQSQMTQMLLNKAGESFEKGIWIGSLDYAGNVSSSDPRYQWQYHDGFIKKMVNDPLINKIANPVNITTSNILAILDNMIAQAALLQPGLMTDESTFKWMKFGLSPTDIAKYMEALRTTLYKGEELKSGVIPPYAGYEVVRLSGMPANTIIFTRATNDNNSNLHVGMNSMQDWNLKVSPLQANSELWFMLGKLKWDVQYGWSEETFLYTTQTPDNFLP